jgi:hypothetical protein
MQFLSKTALGLLAAAGLMAFITPNAEARSRHHHHGHGYSRSYYSGGYGYGYRHYPRRVVYYRSYDPYYYDSYYYGRPYYRSGPSISIGFGGRSFFGGHHHGHHHR